MDLAPLLSSDHNILQLSLTNSCVPHPRRNCRKAWQSDFDTANTTLQCLPTSLDDVNNFWAEWSDVFVVDTMYTKPKTKLPYLSDDLLHLVRRKCRLYSHSKRVGTARAWTKYTKLRNRVTSALRSAKNVYLHQLAEKSPHTT